MLKNGLLVGIKRDLLTYVFSKFSSLVLSIRTTNCGLIKIGLTSMDLFYVVTILGPEGAKAIFLYTDSLLQTEDKI